MSSNTTQKKYRLLIENASQLVVVSSNPNERVKKGASQNQIEIIENGSMIVGHDGRIVAIGTHEQVCHKYNNCNHDDFETVVNAQGKSVVPGLVDGHTHPVWAG